MNELSESSRLLVKEFMQPWKDSGLSINEFCRVNNFSVHKFRYWKRKFLQEKNKKNSHDGFIPIQIKNKSEVFPVENRIEIIYPNGVKLIMSSCKSPAFIRFLIKLA